MKTIKQKEIKNLVKLGAAVDITAEEGSLTRYGILQDQKRV